MLYICTKNDIFEKTKINEYEKHKEVQEKANSNRGTSI
jgi:hypothetical protein